MGQYYKPVVLKEDYENESFPCILSLTPWKMGNGAKLMEHSYVGNNFVEAFAQIIHKNNKKGYADNRVVWCGDYSEPINDNSIYHLAKQCEASGFYLEEYTDGIQRPYQYIVNTDKGQYVKVKPYNENKRTIHPLPLLTAYGNGQGGGHYYGSDMDKVGTWALDHVYTSDEVPEGYEELVVDFKDDTEEP